MEVESPRRKRVEEQAEKEKKEKQKEKEAKREAMLKANAAENYLREQAALAQRQRDAMA